MALCPPIFVAAVSTALQGQLVISSSILTSGIASACALAASVVTVLLTKAVREKALLRKGAATRLVLNARENILSEVEEQLSRTKERREGKGGWWCCWWMKRKN